MTDLAPVDCESAAIIILSPIWFALVLVWAGWCAACDAWGANG